MAESNRNATPEELDTEDLEGVSGGLPFGVFPNIAEKTAEGLAAAVENARKKAEQSGNISRIDTPNRIKA